MGRQIHSPVKCWGKCPLHPAGVDARICTLNTGDIHANDFNYYERCWSPVILDGWWLTLTSDNTVRVTVTLDTPWMHADVYVRVWHLKSSIRSTNWIYVDATFVGTVITFCVSRRRRKMYYGHARLCVCVSICLSAAAYSHTVERTRM